MNECVVSSYAIKAEKKSSFDDKWFDVEIVMGGKVIATRVFRREPEDIEYEPDGEEYFWLYGGTLHDYIKVPSHILREAIEKAQARAVLI